MAMVADGVQYSKARLEEYRGAGASRGDETADRVGEGHGGSSGDYAILPDAKSPVASGTADSEGDGDEDDSLVE